MKKTLTGIRALFGRKGKAAVATVLGEVITILLVKYGHLDADQATKLGTVILAVGIAYITGTAVEDFGLKLSGKSPKKGGEKDEESTG